MRSFVFLLALFLCQASFALPRATPEQCKSWTAQIDKYNDLRRKGASLRKMEAYRNKVDQYHEKRKLGRCRTRLN
ncbi:MAG: hypothetical protein R3E62_00740 [Pseudomonadales bacterium]